jgi:hypothetical protein
MADESEGEGRQSRNDEYLYCHRSERDQSITQVTGSLSVCTFDKRRPMHAEARVYNIKRKNDKHETNLAEARTKTKQLITPFPCYSQGASEGTLLHHFFSSLLTSPPSTSTGATPGICQCPLFVFSGASTSTALSSPWTSEIPTY